MNNHVYPRIHYPEVYILEGGYCKYWKTSGERCQPRAYVRMDDPVHAASRKEDLDQFRKGKFGRTKSYAFGESKSSLIAPQMVKRTSAPTVPAASLFAGNAARGRRTNGMLQTLQEDPNASQQSEDEDTDVGDSPCPPPNKGVSFKGKKIPRAPLARAETYGPTKLALGY
jgi:M-phase inducer tyrosine phosphatase